MTLFSAVSRTRRIRLKPTAIVLRHACDRRTIRSPEGETEGMAEAKRALLAILAADVVGYAAGISVPAAGHMMLIILFASGIQHALTDRRPSLSRVARPCGQPCGHYR